MSVDAVVLSGRYQFQAVKRRRYNVANHKAGSIGLNRILGKGGRVDIAPADNKPEFNCRIGTRVVG